MIFYLDMDGVLVDFVGGIESRFGVNLQAWPDGFYDIREVVQCRLNRKVTPRDFWALGHAFWANLHPTRECKPLIDALEGCETYLLTSPTLEPECASGKMAWIKYHLPQFMRKVIITPQKHLLANSNSVLIDDSDANCQKFISHGGIAICLSRPWNNSKVKLQDLI